jgi:hypothetical protein
VKKLTDATVGALDALGLQQLSRQLAQLLVFVE